MPTKTDLGIDGASPPFDQITSIQQLAPARSGHRSREHARHQLYVAREKRNPVHVLIKVISKPGQVYEHDLTNEISSLSTINRELPDSRYFPVIHQHGRLSDGRLYLSTSLFDELPLATTLGAAPVPGKLVAHLKLAIEIARALSDIHRLEIFHVDLNPMNVLYRASHARPVIRIVDFESSYELVRHSKGAFYSPPTTPGYSAPEISHQAPDARSDLFSLGAVLYTTLAGYRWTDHAEVSARVEADPELDAELKHVLLAAVDPIPDNRYGSVQEFQSALRAYLERIWPGRAW
jgi:serine/threonine protein kinase